MCLHKFLARDSWLNSWEHLGEDMLSAGSFEKTMFWNNFFFPLRTALSAGVGAWGFPRGAKSHPRNLP